jgi:hypothetical protein
VCVCIRCDCLSVAIIHMSVYIFCSAIPQDWAATSMASPRQQQPLHSPRSPEAQQLMQSQAHLSPRQKLYDDAIFFT